MSKVQTLKKRLELLPERLREARLAGTFADYTEKLSDARAKMTVTRDCMRAAAQVRGNRAYEQRVQPELRKVVREAKRLEQAVGADAFYIEKKAAENAVTRIREASANAAARCKDEWDKEIAATTAKWAKIAEVVAALGAPGASAFKTAVDKLMKQTVPQNETEVEAVQRHLEKLQEGVRTLGLEGPFGSFIGAAAARNARPRDLLKDEVRSKLDEYDLWDSFSVALGQ